MLHCLYVRGTIQNYTEPFHTTLHRLCVHCATWNYPEPFDTTLHHLFTVLQMSAKLFAIELVHFTISSSNSTWATRPFIIWLNYSCLGYSVSWRKTKLSIIWPCHSFISYSILQLILKPALFSLIYLLTRLNSWLKLIQITLMFKGGFSIVQGWLLLNNVKVKGGFFISVLYYLYLHSFVRCKQTNQQAGFLDLSLLCSSTRTQLMKLKEIICAKCFQQCTRQQIGPDSNFFCNREMRDFFSWLRRDEILR